MHDETPAHETRAGFVVAEMIARWRDVRHRVGVIAAASVLAAVGVAWWRSGSSSASLPPMPEAVPAPASTSTSVDAGLVVHVVGAVRSPGVIRVRSGARVIDAVTAAGGATRRADLAGLNLAAPIADRKSTRLNSSHT